MEGSSSSWTNDERKVRLLEWLITLPAEREPRTKAGLAEELGVAPRTLRDWQGEKTFRDEWERQAMRVSGGPEKTQRILAALEEQALDDTSNKQVSAAKLWLEATGAITPKGVKPSEQSGRAATKASEMSDEQLWAALSERMAADGS